jgi:hypothetical protein
MEVYEWKEGTSLEEAKNGVYWERNLLALLLACEDNDACQESLGGRFLTSGWYYDTDNNWEGWKRVISIRNGSITFHIPDDFDVGNLEQIKPNWDGHTTKQKWTSIMKRCGCRMERDNE